MATARWLGIGIVGSVLAASASAQPLGPQPKSIKQPVSTGGREFPNGIVPSEQQVEDVRPWLSGLTKKNPAKDLDPKMLKDLIDKVQKLPKDQKADPEQLNDLLDKNPQFKDPAFLEQLKKLAENKDFPANLGQKFPDEKLGPIENGPELKQDLENVIEAAKNQQPMIAPKDVAGPKPDGQNPDVPKDGIDPTTSKPQATDNEWVKWMQKNFGDSQAADGAIKDMIAAMEKKGGKGMFDDIPEFKNGGWKDFDKWGKSNAGDLWKIKPPDTQMGGMSGPKFGGGGGSSWGGSGGGGGGGSSWGGGGGGAGGLGGGASSLAVIAAIAGALLLAFLLFRKFKLNRDEKAMAAAGRPGAIDFDSIRSREQLVNVFNAVSLEQCGEDARNWNHRVIADRFKEVKPAVADPANEVAGLYERARYAPTDEDLSTGEFADARRDLRALAGVTA
jgi:hypothetical protein